MMNLRFKSLSIVVTILVITWSCESDDEGLGGQDVWSIPQDQILSGGVPRDGIPSIDNPQFIGVDEVNTIRDDELVIGFQNGRDIRAYPHSILDWHEIVNDDVSGTKLALTYCPLTGTGVGWNRELDGDETTFGVSGLLFNTNLMPYDRETGNVWSQMLTEGVQGDRREEPAEILKTIEMPWGDWKRMYPNSSVLSQATGFTRRYDVYPYRNYREVEDLLFPVENRDTRLFGKRRVLGVIIDNEAKLYQFTAMNPDGSMTVLNDRFQGRDIIVVGNQRILTAFETSGVSGANEFVPIEDDTPAVFSDNLGNTYDLFGVVIDGPNRGEELTGLESYMGFFFSFGAFYPEPQIFNFE